MQPALEEEPQADASQAEVQIATSSDQPQGPRRLTSMKGV